MTPLQYEKYSVNNPEYSNDDVSIFFGFDALTSTPITLEGHQGDRGHDRVVLEKMVTTLGLFGPESTLIDGSLKFLLSQSCYIILASHFTMI